MIVVKSRDDLPVPAERTLLNPGSRLWTYYIRSSIDHSVVIEAWDGEAYQLASGEWVDEGYHVERAVGTNKVTWRRGHLKGTGDVKSPRRQPA